MGEVFGPENGAAGASQGKSVENGATRVAAPETFEISYEMLPRGAEPLEDSSCSAKTPKSETLEDVTSSARDSIVCSTGDVLSLSGQQPSKGASTCVDSEFD